MSEDVIAAHQAWVRKAVAASGLSPTALAKKAGVAQTTVTRLYFGTGQLFALNAHSQEKLAKASGIPFTVAPADLPEPEATPYKRAPSECGNIIEAILAARASAQAIEMRTRALEGAGVLAGDVMIVDSDKAAKRGDIVRASHREEDHRPAETIFRIYEPPYLLAQTTAEELRRPILIDHDRTTVTGTVVAIVRLRQPG